MGLLNHLFGSTQSIAEKSVKDEELIIKTWKQYSSSFLVKEQTINKLPYLFGERKVYLQQISELLKLELVDIHAGEKEENDLINNILTLEHSKKLKRIEKLEVALAQFNTRYEHIHALLFHLYALLKSEAIIVEKLKNCEDLRKYRKLIDMLKSDLTVENTILKRINNRPTFHNLLVNLVKGEKIVATMDSRERELYKKMQTEMKKIFSNEIKEGVLYNLVQGVFKAIEYKIHNTIANAPKIKPDGLYEYSTSTDFEYVNMKEFVTLVRQMIKIQKITDIMSEQMINVFVHIFREWYNHERG